VKSLFDYQQNKKFLKTEEEGGAVPVGGGSQGFSANPFAAKPFDPHKPRGLTVPVFSQSNPFKIPRNGGPPLF
jgi:hypothetical protein